MREIHVEAPGLFTTIQDLGRPGYGKLGVSVSGAADPIALRLGNRLVGNPENTGALEMTLLGGTFAFSEQMLVAITGSDFAPTLGGAAAPLWSAFPVSSGQRLHVGSTRTGARCYLCIQGGIVLQPFLGSASTHILSGLGGLEGRAMRKGDVLKVGPPLPRFALRKLGSHGIQQLAARKKLRVIEGPQWEWFSESSRELLFTSGYRVTEEANRMGLRLDGAKISINSHEPMITEGVSLGAIQIPSGGQPIILFVEQQTTGGYPKIANIISADISSVGQLRPRDEIHFERVTMAEAHRLLFEQEAMLASEMLEA
jgi:antagonist of KipI